MSLIRYNRGMSQTRFRIPEPADVIALHESGLSYSEIARRSGLDRRRVSGFVREGKGSQEALRALARVLNEQEASE
jgi:transcriptional regulator with XRE-family HTH domain